MLRLDINLVFTVINLLVLYFFMRKFLFGRVNKILEDRKALIEKQFADAKTAQDAADGMKTEYEGKLAAAQGEGEEIIARAKAEAKEQSEKLLAATDAELEQKRRRAEETMAVERANALRDMKSEIATLVIDAAAKAVGDRNTEQQDRMLYDKFIAEAGEAHGGKIQ